MNNRQVPIQADESQDQDAAVKVDRVDDVDSFAQKILEVPTNGSIHRPEWKGEHKEQVGHGEMQPVFVGHSSGLFLITHHQHHQSIADNSQKEDERVDSRQKDSVEVFVIFGTVVLIIKIIIGTIEVGGILFKIDIDLPRKLQKSTKICKI